MAGVKQPATCFVTGGMSGLGKALAIEYVKRGSQLAIFDVAIQEACVAEIESHRTSTEQQVLAYQASVTDAETLAECVQQAVATLGSPQLAINCAGIQCARPFAELPGDHFTQVIEVNLIGSRHFAAAILPHMQAGSRLALVASMAGFAANYSYAAYSASKFGVIGLGRVLRLEYKPRGIAVSLICPPEVDTPMVVEELKHMHPASRRLKDIGGSLSLERAIRGILSGLDAGKGVIIPGFKAKLTYFSSRYLPDFIMHGLVDAIVRSSLRQLKTQHTTTTKNANGDRRE